MSDVLMATSLLAIARAAEDPDFRSRVKAAIFVTAERILSSADTGPQQRSRKYLASAASGTADSLVWQFSWLMASAPAIAETITLADDGTLTIGASDTTLLAVCLAAWDVVAGLTR